MSLATVFNGFWGLALEDAAGVAEVAHEAFVEVFEVGRVVLLTLGAFAGFAQGGAVFYGPGEDVLEGHAALGAKGLGVAVPAETKAELETAVPEQEGGECC